MWIVLLIVALFKLNFSWLIVVVVVLGFLIPNVVGYFKCAQGSRQIPLYVSQISPFSDLSRISSLIALQNHGKGSKRLRRRSLLRRLLPCSKSHSNRRFHRSRVVRVEETQTKKTDKLFVFVLMLKGVEENIFFLGVPDLGLHKAGESPPLREHNSSGF